MNATESAQTSPVASDLRDLRGVPLAELAAAASEGDPALEQPLQRVAPLGGDPRLLVSAGFNSAI